MSRCVIIGAAGIGNLPFLRSLLRPDDFHIFCDGGLYHRERLGIEPHLIVGDFDSHPFPDLPVETVVLPREKDDTDTVYAAKEAVRRGFEEFLLLGAAGGRIDHTLGNLSLLLKLDVLGKHAVLADDFSLMEIVRGRSAEIADSYRYFSLLAMGGSARGVTITGAKYPLENAEISPDYQYGVSNEVLPGQTAKVTVREGALLLVRVAAE